MIQKNDLKGKFVEYIDSDGKRRIEKVVRVTGNKLTVRNVLGRRRRVTHDKVICRVRPKLGNEVIEWK